MPDSPSDRLRDAGYEALCFAAGYLALALHPTMRNQVKVHDWIYESVQRRQMLRRLQQRGLLEVGDTRAGQVLKLTEAGGRLLAGGRHPEEAWNRGWDGEWRLLVFDLPRDAGRSRVQFWRWLRSRHFGNLQGSAWITPDPVPDLAGVLREAGLDPKAVVVFSGAAVGHDDPRELAAGAWNFLEINGAYRDYAEFADRAVRQLAKKGASPARRREVVAEDRKLWQLAIRYDPLLPRVLHAPDYEGPAAWELRTKLHASLARSVAGRGN